MLGVACVWLVRALRFQHRSDQSGPARLVTGPQALATVGMEVLVEQDQVFPVWIIDVA